MKTYIVVRLQIEGMHNFPKAKEIFPEVGFLADRHRHIFHFELKKEVYHDDRDVEFILFKREVEKYIKAQYFSTANQVYEFEHRSCEMLAKELLQKFDCVQVSVFEDGENGAVVEK